MKFLWYWYCDNQISTIPYIIRNKMERLGRKKREGKTGAKH